MVPEIRSVTDSIFCHFRPFFAFLPFNNSKNQNLEKIKKTPGYIIILHECIKNYDHMLHCSWDTTHNRRNFYFSFWAILCHFTPLTTQKIKIFLKNEKNNWDHHFTHLHQKLWLHDVRFLRYGPRWTDGWMDGWKKWHIEEDAPPKKLMRFIL